MLIDETEIRSLIPHAGAMCLLEAVIAWDEQSITCLTDTHRDPANPLRRRGRLSVLHAIEYGAQAAAIHGALHARAAGQTAPPGYLAALRDARWYVAELDAVAEPLEVAARLLLGDAGHCIYAIQVHATDRLLAEARITIVPQPKHGDHR
jgi:predicted hotdog family 3-hydroxylacyl-ACP dehydratase